MADSSGLTQKNFDNLMYEFDMLYYTTCLCESGLDNDSNSQPIKNAYLESFLVHARIVIDFFWLESRNQDDILAYMFVENRSNWEKERGDCPSLLVDTKQRANKKLAHLTFARAVMDDDWKFQEIYLLLRTTTRVFKKHLRDDVRPQFEKSEMVRHLS